MSPYQPRGAMPHNTGADMAIPYPQNMAAAHAGVQAITSDRRPEFSVEFDRLTDRLGYAMTRIDELLQRLEPVLAPDRPMPQTDDKEARPCTPAGMALRDASNVVETLAYRVSSILARLEV